MLKYENAKDIFPEDLLRQIQRYVSGKLIYIPALEEKKSWGETSGYRQYLVERNRAIRSAFGEGQEIDALAEAYALSPESIKRIVYSRKEPFIMEYQGTGTNARHCAQNGKLEDWVHAYLLSDGDNKPFSDGLRLFDRFYLGPMQMPIDLFERISGPEETMPYRIHPGWWEECVALLQETIQKNADLPPLIVHYYIPDGKTEGVFELNDGNHRWEAFKRLGVQTADVIVWITEPHEYEQFRERYGQYLET
ncbi:MAG: ParB-like nuclease domain-containing protein [Clostridia bacterium]|nr:ParB-like nuclease domain-containing protein [Clostridia bacterium]